MTPDPIVLASRARRAARIAEATECAAEWQKYEAGNRRANVEYRVRPAITPLVVSSLERRGVGVTATRFRVPPNALAAWFPELIGHTVEATA